MRQLGLSTERYLLSNLAEAVSVSVMKLNLKRSVIYKSIMQGAKYGSEMKLATIYLRNLHKCFAAV